MTGNLSLAILSTRSSFKDNISFEAEGNPESDTVQIWVGPEMTFQIHTYALDRDIRIYAIKSVPNGLEKLRAIDEKHYADITDRRIEIAIDDTNDHGEIHSKFAAHGLSPTIVIEEDAFIFWRHGDAIYQTISEPLPSIEDLEKPGIVMKGTLFLSVFGVRGNYHEGVYLDARGKPETDTYQWWISADNSCSTMTFALTRMMRSANYDRPASEMIPIALESRAKFSSSIIKEFRLEFDNVFDTEEVDFRFAEVGLEPSLRIYDMRIPIWTFQGIEYKFDSQEKGTPMQSLKRAVITPVRHWFNSHF